VNLKKFKKSTSNDLVLMAHSDYISNLGIVFIDSYNFRIGARISLLFLHCLQFTDSELVVDANVYGTVSDSDPT